MLWHGSLKLVHQRQDFPAACLILEWLWSPQETLLRTAYMDSLYPTSLVFLVNLHCSVAFQDCMASILLCFSAGKSIFFKQNPYVLFWMFPEWVRKIRRKGFQVFLTQPPEMVDKSGRGVCSLGTSRSKSKQQCCCLSPPNCSSYLQDSSSSGQRWAEALPGPLLTTGLLLASSTVWSGNKHAPSPQPRSACSLRYCHQSWEVSHPSLGRD